MSVSSTPPLEFEPTSSSQDRSQPAQAKPKEPTKASRQRFKPQLSCTLCRTRKLKCDRNLPCQNCTKRDLTASCTYVHARINRSKASLVRNSNPKPKDVQSQISHLEALVVSLMNKSGAGNVNKQRDPSDEVIEGVNTVEGWTEIDSVKGASESFGMISIEDDQHYVGSSHWAAILDNIACLKDALENKDKPEQEDQTRGLNPATIGPDLLIGNVKSATKAEILAILPSKPHMEHLIADFFGMVDMGATMFHQPTFVKEFENFWVGPAGTSIMWIGLLFGILSQGILIKELSNQPASWPSSEVANRNPLEMANLFREKMVQCLILGNYTEPSQYTVEALIIYYVSELFRKNDNQLGLWMLLGLIVRAAMRMGFHRDASHHRKISVFQGEMQRRFWSCIVHLDLQTSCQVGLPRMINDGIYDTAEPLNLLDEDFHSEIETLPLSRPISELTPIGYVNLKHRITKILGTIVDQANSTSITSYDEIMRLDKKLHDLHQSAPDFIKLRSVEDLKYGPDLTRIRKLTMNSTFQKARCVLHRKFFVLSKSTGKYAYPYSMKSCIDAAMQIVQYQVYMNSQTRDGMSLASHRWKGSALMTQDFLLAAALICLYLGNCMSSKQTEGQSEIRWTTEDMLQTLQDSNDMWDETKSTSKDAMKASIALKAMLEKVKGLGTAQVPTSTASFTPETIPTPASDVHPLCYINTNSYILPWMTPPVFTEANNPNNPNNPNNSNLNYTTFETMQFDWEHWDNQFYSNVASQTLPETWDPNPGMTFPDQYTSSSM